MSIKRVQKLLFSEYCDFEDMVLIESPFAQTTRDGRGLRQVHLGLTPSKLVLATDVLPPVEKSCIDFLPGIDPDIETFELIAIYPVECVNLSVFRRRKRQTIKAHFCNNRVYYFELGGFENRSMFWNLWCERVKFLSPESGSSHSETSIATSSSNSTLYLVDSKQVIKPNGITQVWCKFGTGKNPTSNLLQKWTDRHLYMGKNFEDSGNYKPIMNSPNIHQFIKPRKFSTYSVTVQNQYNKNNEFFIGDSYQINRFGNGIKEGCDSSLHLPSDDYLLRKRLSQTSGQSSAFYEELEPINFPNTFEIMAEDCVRSWEFYKDTRNLKTKHRRRYGIAPHPLFLYGLGPWNINPGAKYSIQIKRAVSVVTIRRQPAEPELRLPVTKRQLVATISCETLREDKPKVNNQIASGGPRRPVIFFWTPDYWYRPRTAKDAYKELQGHLAKIKEYQQKNKKKRRLFRRRAVPKFESSESDSEMSIAKYRKAKKRKSASRFNVFGSRSNDVCDTDQDKKSKETSLQYLKRLLKIDVVLTAWDFNSTTLAQQLTMIDRDLFLKISGAELSVLISQQSSKNAPNVAALVAFSHRISCLVASDILKNTCERMRARLIARFITVAEKCHRISNFQSCRTVLFGLQSPSIFRLRTTWAYVRKKHGSKYQNFECLCRIYRDPRTLIYQKTFFIASQTSPYLPYIGDIIAKLLDKVPEYKILRSRNITSYEQTDNLFMKLLTSMKRMHFQNQQLSASKKALCHYYKSPKCYEDNRTKCLTDTTEFLQQCQLSALHYSFSRHNLALDYLLKARYKEERDNFFQSFRVESIDCMSDLLQDMSNEYTNKATI